MVGLLIAATAYRRLVRIYKKYSQFETELGITGLNFAANCINYYKLDCKISLTDAELEDGYSMKHKVVVLSKKVAYGKSVADVSITAHEIGHAIQHKNKSAWLLVDMVFAQINRFANSVLPIALLTALVMILFPKGYDVGIIIMYSSIGLWIFTLLFRIITIPMELNASKIAYEILSENRICNKQELKQISKILNAAALTYVASLFINLYKFFRVIFNSFRRD